MEANRKSGRSIAAETTVGMPRWLASCDRMATDLNKVAVVVGVVSTGGGGTKGKGDMFGVIE